MFRQHTNVSGDPRCRLGNEILCGRPGVRHLLLGLHGRGIDGEMLSRGCCWPQRNKAGRQGTHG